VAGRRLRIGIDAHVIGARLTGNERVMAGVLPALREICDHELVLYFTDRSVAGSWPRWPGTEVRLLRPGRRVVRIPFTLPYRAARDRLDVLFVQYTAPPVVGCPVVTLVHDVCYAVHPEYYSRRDLLWMNRTIPFTMRRAAGVVTVSEFSRDEMVRVYGLPAEKIIVAHDGVGPPFTDPTPRPSPVEPPYFLSVGNLQPRKNVATLVAAYRQAVRRRPDLPERLVIVGQEWFAAEQLYRDTEDLRRAGRVVFTGYVDDEALVGLLQHATAFGYPSVYEGFGLPPVEAMAAGTPALVSDIPVMHEVAADAALCLPARDPSAWAEALLKVADDHELRGDLVRKGRERAAGFTWERSARAILTAIEKACL